MRRSPRLGGRTGSLLLAGLVSFVSIVTPTRETACGFARTERALSSRSWRDGNGARFAASIGALTPVIADYGGIDIQIHDFSSGYVESGSRLTT